jgi:hypothetical protein
MKNSKHVLFIFALILSAIFSKAQTKTSSPGMLLDTLYDNSGNKYALNQLKIDTSTVYGTGDKTTALCASTGYFTIYFEPGCGMEQNNPTHNARRNVICELFNHLSSFITSPLTTTGKKVNIWIRDPSLFALLPTASAAATTFYSVPVSTLTGIADNEMWKTINSGQDSYAGIVSPLATTGAFYHGMIAFDFINFNWHDDLTTNPTGSELDLYTIALHEITHSLGFMSNIRGNGASFVPNYYSRYDQFLKSSAGTFLVANTGTCSMYNFGFNTTTTAINPNASSCITDVTTCSLGVTYSSSSQNIPVYTPNCFEAGSSLSHFEDMCYPTNTPTNNNQYFVLCNSVPLGAMRRYLKEEERKVLCDLGYSVVATYGSSSYTTTQKTYTAGTCAGLGVVGINDGLNAGLYTIFTTTGVATGIVSPVANDVGATNFECLQVVIGSGTLSATSGTTFNYTPAIAGVNLLRYIPYNSSTGKRGNITYVFVYVSGVVGCTPSSVCELVTNKGFETTIGGCGFYFNTSTVTGVSCWDIASGLEYVYSRTCANSTYTVPNMLTNTPPFNSWNGAGNDVFVNLTNSAASQEGILQTTLSSGLTNGSQYQISFWAAAQTFSAIPAVPALVDIGVTSAPVILPLSPPATITPAAYTSINKSYLLVDKLWHPYSTTFTFTGTSGSSYLGVLDGQDYATLKAISPSTTGFLIDDISILPVSAASTFSLQPQICIGNNVNNLQTLVSIPNGTFTGPGVTGSAGSYTFNSTTAGAGWQTLIYTYTTAAGCTLTKPGQIYVVGSAPTVTGNVSPTNSHAWCPGTNFTLTATPSAAPSLFTYSWSPGSYTTQIINISPTVTTTYTLLVGDPLGCNAPVTKTVQINITTPSPTINPAAQSICSGQTATLSFTPQSIDQSWTWLPGGSTSTSITVTPTTTTIYTLTVNGYGGCSGSTIAYVYLQCCGDGTMAASLSNTLVGGGTFDVTQNTSITSGTVVMSGGVFKMSPNVNITVASSATLTIDNCHLYACYDMWTGIIVQPGGRLIINNNSMIEDAITAVNIDGHTATTTILTATTAIFNNNYTAIKISNYTQPTSSTSYTTQFSIRDCIFSCRTFTFAGASWASVSSLKTTCSPSNPLATPYCLQGSLGALKAPYAGQTSQCGILAYTVGATSNPSTTPTYTCLQIGDHLNTAYVNIFDNLFYGISAIDANLKVFQNVFQNTQYNSVHGNYFGGIAIDDKAEWTEPNLYLSLKAPSPYYTTRKNKFYDCTYAVKTYNIFEQDLQYSEIRSTQSSSGNYQAGKYGIYSTTNRARQYDAQNNLIYNIENGITLNTTYGSIVFGASTFTNTQYTGLVYLNLNTIAPVASGTIGSEFVSNAITVSNVLSSGSTNSLIANSQINASGNAMKNVYRGINSSNFYTPAFMAQNNTCTLTLDPGSNLQQGIAITTCSNASVQTNVIVGPSTTNTITTGIYASMNNAPKVTCNTVSITYQGFEFAGNQPGTKWKGNSMTTHTIGYALTYTGVVGAQGSASNPIDNTWNGSTWTVTGNYHTSTSASTASNSALYVQNSGVYYPSIHDGNPIATSYNMANSVYTTTGAYSCAGGGARLITTDPDYEQAYLKTLEDIAGYIVTKDNVFDASKYIAQYQLYRILDNDASVYPSSKSLSDFHNSNKTSNYGKLLDGENELIKGNYSSANSALSSISSKNNIENNYSDFYSLYGKYYSKTFSDMDNKTLYTLANKCPFIEGEVIYQARTLYNIINSTVGLFKDNCPINENNSRLADTKNISPVNTWNATVYPNPATDELFISSNVISEDIKVNITDINGRLIAQYNIKTSGSVANIKLDMKSGIYFVTLSNSNGEKVVKKLVIAK